MSNPIVVTVRFGPLHQIIGAMRAAEQQPVCPPEPDAGDWWPNPAMDDHGDPEPQYDQPEDDSWGHGLRTIHLRQLKRG